MTDQVEWVAGRIGEGVPATRSYAAARAEFDRTPGRRREVGHPQVEMGLLRVCRIGPLRRYVIGCELQPDAPAIDGRERDPVVIDLLFPAPIRPARCRSPTEPGCLARRAPRS